MELTEIRSIIEKWIYDREMEIIILGNDDFYLLIRALYFDGLFKSDPFDTRPVTSIVQFYYPCTDVLIKLKQ